MFDTESDLHAPSRAYVEATATPREALAAAAGVSGDDLAAIDAAGALPAPTYLLFDNAIRSPIRTLGEPPANGGHAYYCPSVLNWIRRAALMRPGEPGLLDRLQSWFAADFREALEAQTSDARRYAWSHLFSADGAVNDNALTTQLAALHAEWLNGGWAVCLRRWNGHHVVTKDLERARIGAITENGERDDLSAEERLALFNAIERLDSVMLPFAAYERPHGTPGLFIDRMRERYGV
jgi:hypothetical protein